MSDYAWVITRDHLDNKDVVVVGPRDAPALFISELEAGGGEPFRLYDDDGELYYDGRIVGDYTGFEPLDDYGMPNAGCTETRLINPTTKTWETL